MRTQEDLKARITKRIVDALKRGVKPWVRPWTGGDPNTIGMARNVVSKKRYRGINPLILEDAAAIHGFTSPYWGTFEQWKNLGGMVKKRPANVHPGEWATGIIFWHPFTKTVVNKKTGKDEVKKFLMMRSYNVFNLDQVNGEKLNRFRPAAVPPEPVNPDFQVAVDLMTNSKADIRHGGDKAYYSTRGDFIKLPFKKHFGKEGEYYDTAFHELAHWSEKRLEWKNTYAMNELVAEITACYVSAELALPQSNDLGNHQSYVASWLEAMNNDPKFIFAASTQASKVSNFLLHFVGKGEEYEEPKTQEIQDGDGEDEEHAA